MKDIAKENYPTTSHLGVAGVVTANKNIMANRPSWGEISGDSLGKTFNIPVFTLYNDFVYTSYAIINIKDSDLICLTKAKKLDNQPKV